MNANKNTKIDKLKLLIWKNFTLQRRNKMQTFYEILAPVLISCLLLLIRGVMTPAMREDTYYRSFEANLVTSSKHLKMEYRRARDAGQPEMYIIPYSPDTDFVKNIISKAISKIDTQQFNPPEELANMFKGKLMGFQNGSELRSFLYNPISSNRSLCGIQLNDELINSDVLPDHIKLTLHFPSEMRTLPIRSHFFNWKTDETFPIFQVPGPRNPNSHVGGIPNYSNEGFSPIAHTIFQALAEAKGIDFPRVKFCRFPHPAYLHDDFVIIWKSIMPLVTLICFYNTCVNTTKAIVTEKEDQLKEVMKIMGLDCWLHWSAWFIKAYTYIFFSVILIVIVLKGKFFKATDGSLFALVTNTPWTFLCFFLMMYLATSICFCFLITVFFTKANTAGTVAGLCWIVSFCPYTIITNQKSLAPLSMRLFSALASNTAMSFGFEIIFNNEATGKGLQWSKIWTKLNSDDRLVMGHILLMFILDGILYMLVALYVEQVMPGKYGVAQPWNYCFNRHYWKALFGYNKTNVVGSVPYVETSSSDPNIEPDPKNLNVGLQTINLTKEFNKRVVVDNLNVKLFEGQITIILGHNGAGKTTTMSMLTGIISPTSGTAIIAGHDIRTDIVGARSSLGLCPQHNVLFSDLTVTEHIKFYASLKGLKGKNLNMEIEKYVELLGLKDKRNSLSKTLSGGMKRRLGVGVALCGGSKVVLLDEPSSGLDPASRRELWDLLLIEKEGRTIIMSTHFMDEAEVLGERVAVMAGGKIRAVGSPFFLKKQFGVGYRLTAATTGGPHSPVTDLVQKYIPEATLTTNIGSELSYELPAQASNNFESLLSKLETCYNYYGLTSFGISVGSLEVVFMKVGADAIETLDENDQLVFKEMGTDLPTSANIEQNDSKIDCEHISKELYKGRALWRSQWRAMIKKRKLITLRSWLLLAFQIGIPVIFVMIVLIADRTSGDYRTLPARLLALSEGYEQTETLFSYLPLLNNATKNRMKIYKKYFEGSPNMKIVDIGYNDMENYYLEKARAKMPDVRMKNVAGITFHDDKVVYLWFSSFGYHDQPVSMMLAYNAVFKAASEKNHLSLINYPLPFSLNVKVEMLSSHEEEGFRLALNLGFSLAIVTSIFIMFYIKENVSGSKFLQLTSGLSPLIYWGSAFVWDFLCFLVVSFAIILILFVFQVTGFSTFNQMMRLLFIFIVFIFAVLPLTYLLVGCFDEPASGFSKMCFINFATGFTPYMLFQILKIPILNLNDKADMYNSIFMVVPHFAVCIAIQRQFDGYSILKFCKNLCNTKLVDYLPTGMSCTLQNMCILAKTAPLLNACCIPEDSFFEWSYPGVGEPLCYMFLMTLIFIILLYLKEYKILSNFKRKLRASKLPSTTDKNEDDDVTLEKLKIAQMNPKHYSDHILLCKDMSKFYKDFQAVNEISFCVDRGECFGLLGVNGAGKTTTFKMLTGDIDMSHGDAWVVGKSISKEMKAVYNHMGYCPQFDALLVEMTGRETLDLFAGLKGISFQEREKYAACLSTKLGFTKHLDKLVMEYSGGNKRKLSTAVALLGDPEVVYLDEPTTGMDPMAKRQVWRAVAARREGCVVLTSHSMEECEALCTRVAIMINGMFRCLGSLQHLKSKYSQGFTLMVKLKKNPKDLQTKTMSSRLTSSSLKIPTSPRTSTTSASVSEVTPRDRSMSTDPYAEPLQKFISDTFENSILKESFQGLFTYHISDMNMKYSKIFNLMEKMKDSLNIEDYTVAQTSLEEIFLQFSQENSILHEQH